MTTVGVFGVGLIGGSLGLSLRRRTGGRRYRVIGWGRSRAKLAAAKKKGAIDAFTTDLAAAAAQADIAVLAVPVQSLIAVGKAILPHLKSKAVLTDVGSVKGPILEGLASHLKGRPDVDFVGAHPVAGSEKTGVGNACATLFKDAVCVLTPTRTKGRAHHAVETFWRAAGARVVTIPPARHDAVLAVTSHLPHLIAFALYAVALRRSVRDHDVLELSGGAFRDMTRVAGADPVLWAGILDLNHRAVKRAFADFSSELSKLSSLRGRRLTAALKRVSSAKNGGESRR